MLILSLSKATIYLDKLATGKHIINVVFPPKHKRKILSYTYDRMCHVNRKINTLKKLYDRDTKTTGQSKVSEETNKA